LEETAEVGRLATLPHISEIWVEGNPFVEMEAGYRVSCFEYFWKEGKTVLLDGTGPGFYERRYLSLGPAEQMSSSRSPSAASSPHVIAVNHGHYHTSSETTNILASTSISSPDKGHRKRSKHIVSLDTSLHGHSRSHLHFQTRSDYDNQGYAAPVELPEAATNEGNTSAAPHNNTSSPGYRHYGHRRSEHDSPAHHDSRGPLWNPDSYTSLAVGVSQGFAILSSTDIPRENSIASMLGSVSALPKDVVDTHTDTYRKKIEGLKRDTGDSWLKIYSQGQENSIMGLSSI